MTRTTWAEQERPLLEVLAAGDTFQENHVFAKWAERHGLQWAEAFVMLEDLREAGYIIIVDAFGRVVTARFARSFIHIGELRLTGEGRRLVGLWPRSNDDAVRVVNAIVAELEERLQDEPDEDKRSRMRSILSSVGGAGRDVAIEVVAQIAAKATGIG